MQYVKQQILTQLYREKVTIEQAFEAAFEAVAGYNMGTNTPTEGLSYLILLAHARDTVNTCDKRVDMITQEHLYIPIQRLDPSISPSVALHLGMTIILN